jgi:hypothetical protein
MHLRDRAAVWAHVQTVFAGGPQLIWRKPQPAEKKPMEWTRSETLVMADQACGYCYGLGLREARNESTAVCNCVLRAIFRACYKRFRECAMKEKYISRVSLESNPGRSRKSVWGLKNEEFMADFVLVGKRTLAGDALALDVFRLHFLLGVDWHGCCRKLNIDRGQFFHEVYRVQQRLGRVFRELEPYALFPLDEYFSSRLTKEKELHA